MRLLLFGLIAVTWCAGLLLAEERGPGLSKGAAEVLEAWRDGAGERIAELAVREKPDRWRVADELVRHDHFDAALALANASPPTEAARFADYVLGRRKRAHDPALRAALALAAGAATEAEQTRALEALLAQRGRGDLLEQTLVQVGCAELLIAKGRVDEAAEVFLGAGKSAEKLGWQGMAVRGYYEALQNSFAVNDYEATLVAGLRLLAVEQGGEDQAGVARALMFVGAAKLEVGNHVGSLRYLKESLAAFEAMDDEDGAAWALNNLGMVYAITGEWGKQEAVLERALILARKVGNEYRVANVLGDLGVLHSALGDHARGRDLHLKALGQFESMRDDIGIAQCLGNLGLTYRDLGEFDKSIEHSERALVICRKLGDRMFICTGLNNLGMALLSKGELARALETAEEAVKTARGIGHSYATANSLQSLAEVLVALGRYEEARERLDESLLLSVQSGSPQVQMVGHRGLAEMWLAKKEYARAVHESVRAMEFARELLTGLGVGQAAQARDRIARIYRIAVEAASGWGRVRALFSALEGARAGSLLEALENREEIRAAALPPALLEGEAAARRGLNLMTVRYRRAVEKGNRQEVRRRRAAVDRAREGLHEAIGRIQRDAKRAAHVLYPVAGEIEDVEAELAPDEAFVILSLLGEQARAVVITDTGSRAVELGASAKIEDAARRLIEDPKADALQAGAALGKLLIEPLALPKECRRLLISPDGMLGFVPFSLLAPKHEVVNVPSATAYLLLRADRERHGEGVLALGDPDYGSGSAAAVAAGLSRGSVLLSPLPATRDEAKAVGDVVLLGKKATRSGFLAAVGKRKRWGAVHLACHALVDPDHPMQSALALSGSDTESSLLSCADIFGLRIPADLAVLSACETGKGTVYQTEGILGLTQAFMLAGSPRVLVSLWKVEDEATRALMVKFYELWRPRDGSPGLPAATALKRAQAHVRAQKKWAAPYYWAAWVLWGLPE
jgi:CHAT domain-containing protein